MEERDYSRYPEGFDEIKEMFTELPNDQLRTMYAMTFMTVLLTV